MKRIKDKRKRDKGKDSFFYRSEECIRGCKNEAMKKCGQLSKKDNISLIVAKFVYANLNQIKPVPSLFRRYMDGERISMNTMLDSVGEDGVMIGAMAFRIAEQLEIELPDNELHDELQSIASYINGMESPDVDSDNVLISAVYSKYFVKHYNFMFDQNGYLYALIKNNTTEYNEIQRQIAKIILLMQAVATSNEIMEYIHFCLKRIVLNVFSGDELDLLHKMNDGYKRLLEEQVDVENEEEYKDLMLSSVSTSIALKMLEEIQDVA